MLSDGDKLRIKIRDIELQILDAIDDNDFQFCNELDLELEDTLRELNLLERPNYYKVEK